jgi:hypothetical protein
MVIAMNINLGLSQVVEHDERKGTLQNVALGVAQLDLHVFACIPLRKKLKFAPQQGIVIGGKYPGATGARGES